MDVAEGFIIYATFKSIPPLRKNIQHNLSATIIVEPDHQIIIKYL